MKLHKGMRWLVLVAAVTVLGSFGAQANHGLAATLQGSAGGNAVAGFGTYESGDGNEQTWLFSIEVHGAGHDASYTDCVGVGSVEVGFTSDCGFTIGGIGHSHSFPTGADAHEVSWTDSGSAGTILLVAVV